MINKLYDDVRETIVNGQEAKKRLISKINELLSAQIVGCNDADASDFAKDQLKIFKEQADSLDIITDCFDYCS